MARRYSLTIKRDGTPVGKLVDEGDNNGITQHILKYDDGTIIGSWTGLMGLPNLNAKVAEIKSTWSGTHSGSTPTPPDPNLTTDNNTTDDNTTNADANDAAALANSLGISIDQLNGLEKALNDLINQNKNYYGNKQRALRLGEGETSAKAYGGRYDVDLNQNGTIEDNERGAGNIDSTESVMGRASSSAANRLKQSGISDFNTLVENKNQRTEQDINSALMSLMNSNTNTLADLQNSQWGTEAAAGREILTSAGAYGAATGEQLYKDKNGNWKIKPKKPGDGYIWDENAEIWVAPSISGQMAIQNAMKNLTTEQKKPTSEGGLITPNGTVAVGSTTASGASTVSGNGGTGNIPTRTGDRPPKPEDTPTHIWEFDEANWNWKPIPRKRGFGGILL